VFIQRWNCGVTQRKLGKRSRRWFELWFQVRVPT